MKLPKYVQGWVDKQGRAHHYYRRPGFPRVRLPGLPWSAEFMAAYDQANIAAPAAIGAKRNKPGSVAAITAAYFDSVQYFGSLSIGTQRLIRNVLEEFREQYGAYPLSLMPPKVITLLLTNKTPGAGRNWLYAIRSLCLFALATDLIKTDPTASVKLKRIKKDGFHTWSDDEIAQYEAKHLIGSKARLALALGIYTAQRRSDVVRMGRQHVRNGVLHVKQQKTGATLAIPVHPHLQRVIDSTAGDHLTFLVTDSGRPVTANGLSKQFRLWCDEARLPDQCTFHGLRKAACRRLAEAGCTAHEIAAMSGHVTLAEVQRYTKAADQAALARSALARIQGGASERQTAEVVVSSLLESLEKIGPE